MCLSSVRPLCLLPGLSASSLLVAVASAEISLLELQGVGSEDNFGRSVAPFGDADGDGVRDFLIGAPGARVGGAQLGAAYVISGRDGSVLRSWNGTTPGLFGYTVVSAGDANADGVEDVAVSALLWSEVHENGGAVFVYSGRDGTLLHQFHADQLGDLMGYAVVSPGDLDGDRYDDLVIGSPRHYLPDTPGLARAYSGRTGAVLYTILPDGPVAWLGYALGALGDLDGDGRPDFAVGAPIDESLGHDAGMVRVVSGASGATLASFYGEEEDYFGRSLSAAGDLNRDGFLDLLIGAPAELGTPYVAVRSGRSGAELVRVLSDAEHTEIGWFVAGPGDIDGDGFPDLAVSGTGNVQILSGRALVTGFGQTRLFDLRPPFGAGEEFSFLSGAGDANGDGFADFLVGQPSALGNRGRVELLAGTACSVAEVASYGHGWPGTAGEPELLARGLPALGESMSLRLTNSLGAPTSAFLFGGYQPAHVVTPWDVHLLIVPAFALPLIPRGSGDFGASVELAPSGALCGLEVFLQGFVRDPGASRGYAASAGLHFRIGN